MKTRLFLLMCLMNMTVHAMPSDDFLSCKLKNKVATSHADYILNKVPQSSASEIYLIKNKSTTPIIIDHTSKREGASAGWSSYLDPGRWSAISVSETRFNLKCMVVHEGKGQPGNCTDLITICQPKHAKASKKIGNYWLTENKTWDDFLIVLQEKEVIPSEVKPLAENM